MLRKINAFLSKLKYEMVDFGNSWISISLKYF